MSQTRQSPSGQHEDVVEDAVETIKVGLKNCIQVMFKYASFPFVQEGDDHILVQEYRGIRTEEFNKLYELLKEARLRYVSGRFTDAIMS
jgi:hypothetical protein